MAALFVGGPRNGLLPWSHGVRLHDVRELQGSLAGLLGVRLLQRGHEVRGHGLRGQGGGLEAAPVGNEGDDRKDRKDSERELANQ
eukprot:13125726-Alexandrium_andersonii.AAC.1